MGNLNHGNTDDRVIGSSGDRVIGNAIGGVRWPDDPITRWSDRRFLCVFVVGLLLCGTLSAVATPPLWETDVERGFRFQNFDRARDATWKQQQGILFLTPDRLLIYQVNRTSGAAKLVGRSPSDRAGNFLLKIKVLSTNDGHVLNSMDIATSGEPARIVATRGGGFVVRAGAALYGYSPGMEQAASRDLSSRPEGPFSTWQLQASPSGAKIVLLHEQVISQPELLSDNTIIHDGRANLEAQILDPVTLQLEESFTLPHALAFWAAGEGSLFSSNPAHSYSDGQIGVLDFTGSWSAFRSDLPKEQHFCRYGLTAIDDQRVVFFGCDSFSLFSRTGEHLFSRTEAGCVLGSAAAAGQYLALRCDRYEVQQMRPKDVLVSAPRAERIDVYDLERRRQRLSVRIHGESACFAVSAQGDLAVVDGAMLRLFHLER